MHIFLGVLDILVSVLLIVIVLAQSGRSANLSGSISGAAETFLGKKGKSVNQKLTKATPILAVVFVIITLILNALALAGKI